MLKDEVIAANQSSWVVIAAFVARFPDDSTWREWKATVGQVIQAGLDSGLDRYFRAGQSMQHIIFSTAERHGLEHLPSPVRVTLGFDPEPARLLVASSYGNVWLGQPERQEFVCSENILPVLKSYLTALWLETRPDELLPPPLA